MKEIEILVEVYDSIDEAKRKLSKFKYEGLKRTIDEYYYDPLRKNLKPDLNNNLQECLRIRRKDGKQYITFKDDVYENGLWLYSNEYETEVDSYENIKEIFQKLGLIKFIEIDNNKETYIFEDYEIVLEDVKNLGVFLEVEYMANEDIDVKKKKVEIQKFIDNLKINVSNELNIGKPEMFMKKHNIKI